MTQLDTKQIKNLISNNFFNIEIIKEVTIELVEELIEFPLQAILNEENYNLVTGFIKKNFKLLPKHIQYIYGNKGFSFILNNYRDIQFTDKVIDLVCRDEIEAQILLSMGILTCEDLISRKVSIPIMELNKLPIEQKQKVMDTYSLYDFIDPSITIDEFKESSFYTDLENVNYFSIF